MSDPYRNAHNAVCALRGPAAIHQCSWCWGDAEQWAYSNSDRNEQTDGRRRWSTDPAHYRPMCRRCHRAFDRLHRESAGPEQYEREFIKARNRHTRAALSAMAERRVIRVATYVTGKRRIAPLPVVQTTIKRVMA